MPSNRTGPSGGIQSWVDGDELARSQATTTTSSPSGHSVRVRKARTSASSASTSDLMIRGDGYTLLPMAEAQRVRLSPTPRAGGSGPGDGRPSRGRSWRYGPPASTRDRAPPPPRRRTTPCRSRSRSRAGEGRAPTPPLQPRERARRPGSRPRRSPCRGGCSAPRRHAQSTPDARTALAVGSRRSPPDDSDRGETARAPGLRGPATPGSRARSPAAERSRWQTDRRLRNGGGPDADTRPPRRCPRETGCPRRRRDATSAGRTRPSRCAPHRVDTEPPGRAVGKIPGASGGRGQSSWRVRAPPTAFTLP